MTIEEIVARCEALRRTIIDVVPALPIDEWCDRYEDPHLKGYSLIGKWKPAEDPRVLTVNFAKELPEKMDDPALWSNVFDTIEMLLEHNLWKPLFTPMCTDQYHDKEGREKLHAEVEPLKKIMEELVSCKDDLDEELPKLLFDAWRASR